jgi:hypothetical protein
MLYTPLKALPPVAIHHGRQDAELIMLGAAGAILILVGKPRFAPLLIDKLFRIPTLQQPARLRADILHNCDTKSETRLRLLITDRLIFPASKEFVSSRQIQDWWHKPRRTVLSDKTA